MVTAAQAEHSSGDKPIVYGYDHNRRSHSKEQGFRGTKRLAVIYHDLRRRCKPARFYQRMKSIRLTVRGNRRASLDVRSNSDAHVSGLNALTSRTSDRVATEAKEPTMTRDGVKRRHSTPNMFKSTEPDEAIMAIDCSDDALATMPNSAKQIVKRRRTLSKMFWEKSRHDDPRTTSRKSQQSKEDTK